MIPLAGATAVRLLNDIIIWTISIIEGVVRTGTILERCGCSPGQWLASVSEAGRTVPIG
jgi:hypothetical protein